MVCRYLTVCAQTIPGWALEGTRFDWSSFSDDGTKMVQLSSQPLNRQGFGGASFTSERTCFQSWSDGFPLKPLSQVRPANHFLHSRLSMPPSFQVELVLPHVFQQTSPSSSSIALVLFFSFLSFPFLCIPTHSYLTTTRSVQTWSFARSRFTFDNQDATPPEAPISPLPKFCRQIHTEQR